MPCRLLVKCEIGTYIKHYLEIDVSQHAKHDYENVFLRRDRHHPYYEIPPHRGFDISPGMRLSLS